MKIKMSAEQVAGLFEFAMLQDLDPTSMEPMKVSRDSAELKLMDGKPVFRVRVTALDRIRQGWARRKACPPLSVLGNRAIPP